MLGLVRQLVSGSMLYKQSCMRSPRAPMSVLRAGLEPAAPGQPAEQDAGEEEPGHPGRQHALPLLRHVAQHLRLVRAAGPGCWRSYAQEAATACRSSRSQLAELHTEAFSYVCCMLAAVHGLEDIFMLNRRCCLRGSQMARWSTQLAGDPCRGGVFMVSMLETSQLKECREVLVTGEGSLNRLRAAHHARRHTEDMDLASVNYLHYGAPKSWYCIPPAHRERFERLLQGLLPDMFRACPEFLRHKVRLLAALCATLALHVPASSLSCA